MNNELISFHRFISEQLQAGRGDLSPEEALDLWRILRPVADAAGDTVLAVEGALHDIEQGDQGVPLYEFDREFRQRHGMSE